MFSEVYIGLGANLGDREKTLQEALAQLAATPGIKVVKTSAFYQTSAWGKTEQPFFLNAVAFIETELQPLAFLKVLQHIEIKLGRLRLEKWGPRTIDLDILLWDRAEIDLPELKVPHPYMRERAFVLVPLAEIAPGLRFADGATVEEVLHQVSDREGGYFIEKYKGSSAINP